MRQTRLISLARSMALASAVSASLLAGLANAQVTEEERAPAPPPLPETAAEAVEVQPEVVIRQTAYGVAQEYRFNGRLYMVRIKPRVGPEYFLIDNDGDGYLESRYNQQLGGVNPPMWRLFSW